MTPEERRAFILEHTTPGRAPIVPEIELRVGGASMPLWEAAALADMRPAVPPPYWAWPWPGGQTVARYVLDMPEVVLGRRVLDVGTGGGIVAIAAALAGAAHVTADDIEPYAITAARLNAEANGVELTFRDDDLVGLDDGWDVVLAGDVWYEAELAERMTPWLRELSGRGATVLTGDLGRAYLPTDGLVELARHDIPTLVDLEDTDTKVGRVLRFDAA
jgi:predicted nicotinamide N-methyase